MSNEFELPSKEKLEQLSLRAVVAYAARCARRVQPLYHSDDPKHVEAVEQAILVAENFASSNADVRTAANANANANADADAIADANAVFVAFANANADANADANTAAKAAHHALTAAIAAAKVVAYAADANAADDAALAAAYAADAAYTARANDVITKANTDEKFIFACQTDFEKLLALTESSVSKLGNPIKLEELGPLWPE